MGGRGRESSDGVEGQSEIRILKYEIRILKYEIPILKYEIRTLKYEIPILKYEFRILKYEFRLALLPRPNSPVRDPIPSTIALVTFFIHFLFVA